MARSPRAAVQSVLTLATPYFYNRGFNKHLDPALGMFGPKRPLRVYRPAAEVVFDGFILRNMLALSEDGPITDASGGGCVITWFEGLPMEDVTLLHAWAKAEFA